MLLLPFLLLLLLALLQLLCLLLMVLLDLLLSRVVRILASFVLVFLFLSLLELLPFLVLLAIEFLLLLLVLAVPLGIPRVHRIRSIATRKVIGMREVPMIVSVVAIVGRAPSRRVPSGPTVLSIRRRMVRRSCLTSRNHGAATQCTWPFGGCDGRLTLIC